MTQPLLITCLCKQDFHLPDIVLSGAKTETKPYPCKNVFCGGHGLQQMACLRALPRAFTFPAWGCDYFLVVQLGANYSFMVAGQLLGWLGKAGSCSFAAWDRIFARDKGVFCQEERRIQISLKSWGLSQARRHCTALLKKGKRKAAWDGYN